MVNTLGLGLRIVYSGKSKSYLARKIGRTYMTLCNKINNKTKFTKAEIQVLCDELNITDPEEVDFLFFYEG